MATKTKTPTYEKSSTGMYAVKLSASHEHAGHLYKPSVGAITVNEEILEDMLAHEVVAHVEPA